MEFNRVTHCYANAVSTPVVTMTQWQLSEKYRKP